MDKYWSNTDKCWSNTDKYWSNTDKYWSNTDKYWSNTNVLIGNGILWSNQVWMLHRMCTCTFETQSTAWRGHSAVYIHTYIDVYIIHTHMHIMHIYIY